MRGYTFFGQVFAGLFLGAAGGAGRALAVALEKSQILLLWKEEHAEVGGIWVRDVIEPLISAAGMLNMLLL